MSASNRLGQLETPVLRATQRQESCKSSHTREAVTGCAAFVPDQESPRSSVTSNGNTVLQCQMFDVHEHDP